MTFTLDTSGDVGPMPAGPMNERCMRWSDLTPFTQGYIEALFASICPDEDGSRELRAPAFSDLAPETLARIITDCAAAHPRYVIPCHPGGPESGHLFWIDRQSPDHIHGFPPLTVQLCDDGKVMFA